MEEELRYRGKKESPGSSSVAPREDREPSPVSEHAEKRQTRGTKTSSSDKGLIRRIIRWSSRLPQNIRRVASTINDLLQIRWIATIDDTISDIAVCFENERVHSTLVNLSWKVLWVSYLSAIVLLIRDIILVESAKGVIAYTRVLQVFCVQAMFPFAFLLLVYLTVQFVSSMKHLGEFFLGKPISQYINDLGTCLLIGWALQILLDLSGKPNTILLQMLIAMSIATLISSTLVFLVVCRMLTVFSNRWRFTATGMTYLFALFYSYQLVSLITKAFANWGFFFPLLAKMIYRLNERILKEESKSDARQQKQHIAHELMKREETAVMQQKEELHMSMTRLQMILQGMLNKIGELLTQMHTDFKTWQERILADPKRFEADPKRFEADPKRFEADPERSRADVEIIRAERADVERRLIRAAVERRLIRAEIERSRAEVGKYRKAPCQIRETQESQETTQSLAKPLVQSSKTPPAHQGEMAHGVPKLSESALTLLPARTSDVSLDNLFLHAPSSTNNPTEIDSPTPLKCLITETSGSLPSQRALLHDVMCCSMKRGNKCTVCGMPIGHRRADGDSQRRLCSWWINAGEYRVEEDHTTLGNRLSDFRNSIEFISI